jgi:hypothetical protein
MSKIKLTPKFFHTLGCIGVLLILTSASLELNSSTPKAQAIGCASNGVTTYPSFPGGPETYTTNWHAERWLEFQTIPVGASQWRVLGRTKGTSGDVCFQEQWKLSKVVISQVWRDDGYTQQQGFTGGDTRGRIVTSNDWSNEPQIGLREAATNSGSSDVFTGTTTYNAGAGCGRFFYNPFDDPQCFNGPTRTIQRDPAFAASSGSGQAQWDQVGQYGILRNSKDALKESKTFLPLEWQVVGYL